MNDANVTFTSYLLERAANDPKRGFRALLWRPGSQAARLNHHSALLEFEDIETNIDIDIDNNDNYMNGLSTEGRTRGAAGRISTANGLVLFCTTVHEALVKFEKARADKAAADAAIAAERAQQLAIEQPVTSALHRLGFVVDLGKPVTIDAMKAFIRAQLQLSDVPKVNKTGNRETLYANVQRILETQNVRFLRADELDHACRSCAKLYDENERDANRRRSAMDGLRGRRLWRVVLPALRAYRRFAYSRPSSNIININAAAATCDLVALVIVVCRQCAKTSKFDIIVIIDTEQNSTLG